MERMIELENKPLTVNRFLSFSMCGFHMHVVQLPFNTKLLCKGLVANKVGLSCLFFIFWRIKLNIQKLRWVDSCYTSSRASGIDCNCWNLTCQNVSRTNFMTIKQIRKKLYVLERFCQLHSKCSFIGAYSIWYHPNSSTVKFTQTTTHIQLHCPKLY